MLFFNNTKMMNKLNLIFCFNIVSLTFLTWISHRDNEVVNHNIYLNMNYFKGTTLKVRNDRLLTNDGQQSEIGQSGPSDNTILLGEQNKLKYITESSEVHENIKKNTSNSMHSYIKKLEHGYTNKKGLKRLDCHYEKKLFDEMYKLDKIAGHMKSKNSYFKKVIWKRYRFLFMIFVLIMIFGITSSTVCQLCANSKSTIHVNLKTGILSLNAIFYTPLIIAFITFIIYIFGKVKKYKRLKKKYKNSGI